MMAQTPRKNLKTRSSTSSKSSGTQTGTPQNGSQASTRESDETSTQKTTEDSSSSPLSEEDENDALFADADAQAAGAAQDDEEESDEDQDAEGDSSASKAAPGNVVSEYGIVATGPVHTFKVEDNRGGYTFKGHVQNNIIIVAEAAYRELGLPGTKRTTKVLVHHKGQTLARRSFEKFSTKKIKED